MHTIPVRMGTAVLLAEVATPEGYVRMAFRIWDPEIDIDQDYIPIYDDRLSTSFYMPPTRITVQGVYQGMTMWKGEWPSEQPEIEETWKEIET